MTVAQPSACRAVSATVTHVCTLNYVAKMLGEGPELLEAIVYNDDNLTYVPHRQIIIKLRGLQRSRS